MASYCKVILIGNVGRKPELRVLADGKKVASFSIAINDPLNKQQPPTWYRVSVWGNRADTIMNYVDQGNNIYVEGRLDLREYVDQAGQKRTSPEVTATDFQFLGSRADSNQAAGGTQRAAEEAPGSVYAPPTAPAFAKSEADDDDLPF